MLLAESGNNLLVSFNIGGEGNGRILVDDSVEACGNLVFLALLLGSDQMDDRT